MGRLTIGLFVGVDTRRMRQEGLTQQAGIEVQVFMPQAVPAVAFLDDADAASAHVLQINRGS